MRGGSFGRGHAEHQRVQGSSCPFWEDPLSADSSVSRYGRRRLAASLTAEELMGFHVDSLSVPPVPTAPAIRARLFCSLSLPRSFVQLHLGRVRQWSSERPETEGAELALLKFVDPN